MHLCSRSRFDVGTPGAQDLFCNIEFSDDVRLQSRRRDPRLQVPAQSRPSMALPDSYWFVLLSPFHRDPCSRGIMGPRTQCGSRARLVSFSACLVSAVPWPFPPPRPSPRSGSTLPTVRKHPNQPPQISSLASPLPIHPHLPQGCPSHYASSTPTDSSEDPSTSAGSPTQ